MEYSIRPHKRMLILLIVGFTVISAFGCFAIVGRHLINYDMFTAGDTFVEETRSNSIAVVLICSIIQIATLFSGKRGARVVGVVASSVSLLQTAIYAPLYNASKQLVGGITSYYCEITWLGYIAIFLSVAILLLHIYSLKKPT